MPYIQFSHRVVLSTNDAFTNSHILHHKFVPFRNFAQIFTYPHITQPQLIISRRTATISDERTKERRKEVGQMWDRWESIAHKSCITQHMFFSLVSRLPSKEAYEKWTHRWPHNKHDKQKCLLCIELHFAHHRETADTSVTAENPREVRFAEYINYFSGF